MEVLVMHSGARTCNILMFPDELMFFNGHLLWDRVSWWLTKLKKKFSSVPRNLLFRILKFWKKNCQDKAKSYNCNNRTLNSDVLVSLVSPDRTTSCVSYSDPSIVNYWIQSQIYRGSVNLTKTSCDSKALAWYPRIWAILHLLEQWSFLTHIAEISRIKENKKQWLFYVVMFKSVLHFWPAVLYLLLRNRH